MWWTIGGLLVECGGLLVECGGMWWTIGDSLSIVFNYAPADLTLESLPVSYCNISKPFSQSF